MKRIKEWVERKISSVCDKREDEWFDLLYRLDYCDTMERPKAVSFKKHIQILKEIDDNYDKLLNDYNKLVNAFNGLQKAFYEATGEYYKVEE